MIGHLSSLALDRLADHLEHISASELVALSRQAGVVPAQAWRARKRRKVDATSFLLLCSALGVEPANGARSEPLCRKGHTFSFVHLATALYFARFRRKLTIRAAAPVLGLSTATLSRVEAGQPTTIETLLRVCSHLGLPATCFLVFTGNSNCNIKDQHKISVPCPLCAINQQARRGL
jgi:DNA-binding Xre family transcriptional regulator